MHRSVDVEPDPTQAVVGVRVGGVEVDKADVVYLQPEVDAGDTVEVGVKLVGGTKVVPLGGDVDPRHSHTRPDDEFDVAIREIGPRMADEVVGPAGKDMALQWRVGARRGHCTHHVQTAALEADEVDVVGAVGGAVFDEVGEALGINDARHSDDRRLSRFETGGSMSAMESNGARDDNCCHGLTIHRLEERDGTTHGGRPTVVVLELKKGREWSRDQRLMMGSSTGGKSCCCCCCCCC